MSEELKKETGMLNASVAHENFDWEAFEGSGVYDSADKDEIRTRKSVRGWSARN